MPPATLASRSKLGVAYKHLKFLSPRARKLLSILFATGLFFFAFLSLSIYVKDPESVHLRRPSTVSAKQRRSLASGGTDGHHSVSRHDARSDSGAAVAREPLRLLLASHNRLFWYHVENNTVQVLHEGQGVHYGVFPGELTADGKLKTVWNVIRPHNWHPKTSQEFLVQLDATTGQEVSRVQLHSRFTHDAVRRGDRVYVANTEGGEVQELAFPDMKLVRSMRLFSLRQHVNTLAPEDDGTVWAVLHNLGKSDAVKVDPAADPRPLVTETLKSVGLKAHGLVAWGPPAAPASAFVVLDSENGAVALVERATGEVTRRWQTPSTEEPPKFLKGLCVVDDVAYFGINVWGERKSRDSTDNDAELAAVDLNTGALLWRRRVPTHGLLNIVAAPQLGEASTYRAMTAAGGVAPAGRRGGAGTSTSSTSTSTSSLSTTSSAGGERSDAGGGTAAEEKRSLISDSGSRSAIRTDAGSTSSSGDTSASTTSTSTTSTSGDAAVVTGISDPRVEAATQKLVAMGFRPKIGGRWSSGQPRLDLATKNSVRSWEAGVSLPLMRVNIDKLKDRLLTMPDDMWDPARQRRENAAVDGRSDNMHKFKPGVEALYMVFSDQSTEHVYRFPYYDYFKDAVEPLLQQILGREDMNKVVRLQFARMKPGSEIKPHQDMGGYAKFAHRIHLPIVSNSNISFEVCPNADRDSAAAQPRRLKGAGSLDPQGGGGGGGGGAGKLADKDCVVIPMEEGMVFELNNRVMHHVHNYGDIKRIQMVVDVSEQPRRPRRLKPGTVCTYDRAVMSCPQTNMLPDY